MKKMFFISGCMLVVLVVSAQSVSEKLKGAFDQFEKDAQLQNATSSLYVIDATTGNVLFDKNSTTGLAPASTQKIITSVTAFELLGKDYRYKTEFGIINDKSLKSLFIKPSGDPTLGSWRWTPANDEKFLDRLGKLLTTKGVNTSKVYFNLKGWSDAPVPDGWIWQDIGNYYGAGAVAFNWRENQYDIVLRSGNSIGDDVTIVATKPVLADYPIISTATAAGKGTGDNAYIYLPVNGNSAIIRGTIPVNENSFEISGSMIDPQKQFVASLNNVIKRSASKTKTNAFRILDTDPPVKPEIFHTELSPSLDSIIYWFNKKSINLYGEALIKTIAYEKKGFGATDTGLSILKDFWKQHGLYENELNMYDGSGLSPLNRVTTHAQVTILKYAKDKSWFPAFYDALPEFNNMKMKSGTISDVKGFCGYHRSRDGKEYIFSFLVNNYNGRASALVNKMYKVLDVLK